MPVTTRFQSRKRQRSEETSSEGGNTTSLRKRNSVLKRVRKTISSKTTTKANRISNSGTPITTSPLKFTQKLWNKQDQHKGDRWRLFQSVARHLEISGTSRTAVNVLYPGSFVDIAPSFVFPNAVYVDLDKRANRFFKDTSGRSVDG